MLLITDIMFEEVPRDIWDVETIPPIPPLTPALENHIPQPDPNRFETVYGTKYIYPDGRDIVIGMTNKVRELLGVPLDEVTNLREVILDQRFTIADLRQDTTRYSARMGRINQMTFWDRLKFLFTGNLIG